ncbi:Spore germination protein B3 [Paenibacillus sp. JJ-100]|uniref:Ger(x)C family spore germination protein n=1 Tax=Paenibacillus sp. JJ-100 TaxID=2974896 RepID=UPI0022FF6230|nr:Ger(x)C family spore germination protein [Paenibacillus sp. JJ-100]CAI6082179.1 Spore germination protein B3 [Paenibacillus sp. JJ-100]
MKIKKAVYKAIFLFIVFAGAVLVLTGCWDQTEIDELAIVTSAAFDKSDHGQVDVSLEVLIPSSISGGSGGGSGSGGSGSEEKTMIKSSKGVNIADALSKLQSELPRHIFFGLCKVFIFGEELAKEGLQDHLDYLVRDPRPRERSFIFISQGKAKHMIELSTLLEVYSAEAIRKMANMEYGMKVTLLELDEMIAEEDRSAAIPYLTTKMEAGNSGEVKELPKMDGIAVCQEDRMVGRMSRSTTRGLLWLRGEIKDYTVSFTPENEEGKLSVTPISTEVHLIPKIQDEEWKVIIHIKTDGTIAQNGTNLNLSDAKTLKKVEYDFGEAIKSRVSSAFQEMQKMKADVIYLGKRFHRKYPKQWKKVKGQWEEFIPEVKTEFVIDAHIGGLGYTNKSVESEER